MQRVKHKNLNKKSLEALAMCGALDSLMDRSIILSNSEELLAYHRDFVKDTQDQRSLFDFKPSFKLKPGKEIKVEDKLAWERELLGLYVSGFPLDPWKDKIMKRPINIESIQHDTVKVIDGIDVSIPVLIEKVKITKTKKGDRMALLSVRDYTGMIEIAVFPETYEKYKNRCVVDSVTLLRGKVSTRNGERTIVVDELKEIARE